MLAVLEIGWNQFTVKVWDIIDVDNQGEELGSMVKINPLLVSDFDWKDTKIGTPVLSDIFVELKTLDNFKDDKVTVFKMKSKKRYTRNRWFRPSKTKFEVISIA